MQKGFNSQVPRTCKLLPIDKCQTKACQLPQFASAKKLKNSFHFTSATQKPEDCFNSSVPKTCNLLPIHKCHTKACKLLQFTSVRKTCKMLTTHNLPVPRLCKLLQFFAFHSQVPNNGLQTALIHKCQEPCTVPVNLQYALPCYAAPCYAAPCYASPCYAAPCYPAPCYAAQCYDASCYTAPCHATPCHLKRYFSHVLHRNSLMPCCVTLTNAARNLHSLLPKPYNGSI